MVKKIVGFLKRTGLYYTRPMYWLKNRALQFMGRSMQKNGMACLTEIHRAMGEAGCEYWVDFGTLLGLHREGRLLKHDFDIDFSIMGENYSDQVKKSLKKRGFQLHKEYFAFGKVVEQSWRWKGVFVDLFMYQRKGDKMFHYEFYTDKEVEETKVSEKVYRFSGLDARTVLVPPVVPVVKKLGGISVMVPKDREDHLRRMYGKNYMVPDKSWQPLKRPNVFQIENLEMYAYRYVIK
ncbi:MAG: hypothetical protein HFI63_04700 [Lachnospiraceae bacterium]|nr:hypothetical protein [Lachnospiraceae bacterium]